MNGLRYAEVAPPPVLVPYVECLWSLQGSAQAARCGPQPVLPDGRVELVLHHGARFWYHAEDGRRELQPRAIVVGPTERFVALEPRGPVDVVGVRFRPGGAAPFFGTAMPELRGRIPALDETLPRFSLTSSPRLAALADALVARAARIDRTGVDPAIAWVARRIEVAGGRVRVGGLAREVGLSERQLERRFGLAVGLGPKRFASVVRFQRVFRAFEEHAGDWAAIALACGYVDQSHLIRDFTRYAGRPPAALFGQLDPLTRTFTSGSSKTPAADPT